MLTVLHKRSARMPSQEALKSYLRYARRFTARTQQHYQMVIWRFYAYMPFCVCDLTVEHIERYLDSIKATNRTKNAHLTVVKSLCRYLHDYHDLPNKAAKIKMLPEDPPKQRVITEEEYNKVLAVAKPDEKDLIRFIANTGLRDSEIRSLTRQNVSHDRKYLSLVGKGRKRRIVPLNAICQEILCHSAINFFESHKKRNSIYVMCKKLSRKAGIPVAGPHSYRHFFATRLMQKGVPLAKISKILGHSSIQTTERIYIHWLPQDLLGVTDVLDG